MTYSNKIIQASCGTDSLVLTGQQEGGTSPWPQRAPREGEGHIRAAPACAKSRGGGGGVLSSLGAGVGVRVLEWRHLVAKLSYTPLPLSLPQRVSEVSLHRVFPLWKNSGLNFLSSSLSLASSNPGCRPISQTVTSHGSFIAEPTPCTPPQPPCTPSQEREKGKGAMRVASCPMPRFGLMP